MNKTLSGKIIKRNEKDANIVVAKIFFITFLLFTLETHILNHSGSPFNNFKKSDFNNRYHFISVNQIRKVNNHHI